MADLPEFLKQGERARIFPVLADTSKEKRITSILLAVMSQVPALAESLLSSTGRRIGRRTKIDVFTEVIPMSGENVNGRPDGLIILSSGKETWSALIEAKIGKAELQDEQVCRYVETARSNNIPAVITISNQFVARADHSPVAVPKTLLKKTALFHWSWTWISTQCEILLHQQIVEDREQAFLLSEFVHLLNHPKTGIERFAQMASSWKELVQLVASQGNLKKSDSLVEDGVGCWFQEVRDLCLQMSRHVGKTAITQIDRKLVDDPVARLKDGVSHLVSDHALVARFRIPDCAADIDICADLLRKSVTVGMRLKACLDRKSTKARVNWLVRMLQKDDPRLIVRAHWPGRTPPTQELLSKLREDPAAIQTDNPAMTPHSFEVMLVEDLGGRFGGRRTFIEDIERVVPEFYDLVGQNLRAWQPSPPKPVKASPMETATDLPALDEMPVQGVAPKE